MLPAHACITPFDVVVLTARERGRALVCLRRSLRAPFFSFRHLFAVVGILVVLLIF